MIRTVLRISVCCLFLLLPATVLAKVEVDAFTECGFNCKVISVDAASKSGLVEITGPASEVGETLEIPATLVHGYADGEWTFVVSAIGEKAFAENKALRTVRFPAQEESSLSVIGPLAFHHCTNLKSINLEDTKIEVLESLFTKDMYDEESLEDLTELRLPETLKEIKPYALQFLGLTSITFPSGITTLGDRVLEGDIYLIEFVWEHCQLTSIPRYTFWGDDKLERVVILTDEPLEWDGLSDKHFTMCDKDLLNVYVSYQSYLNLVANGYSKENARYSTLVADTEWQSNPGSGEDPDAIVSLEKDLTTGAIFNLQGIRVGLNQLHKGELYIKDGKKYVKN